MAQLFLILTLILSSLAFANTVCTQAVGSCEYYSCAQQSLGCQPDHYFLSFGKRYCDRFQVVKGQFTDQGRNFANRVGLCLQQKLENDFNQLTCANSKVAAANHHVDCYVELGFCSLGLWDQTVIFNVVLKPVLTDITFQNVAERISRKCWLEPLFQH